MSNQHRRPAGAPGSAGGQFAAETRDESSLSLTADEPGGSRRHDAGSGKPEVHDLAADLLASVRAAKERREARDYLIVLVRERTGCDPRFDPEFGGVTVEPCAECRKVTTVTTLNQDGEQFSRVCADCAGLT